MNTRLFASFLGLVMLGAGCTNTAPSVTVAPPAPPKPFSCGSSTPPTTMSSSTKLAFPGILPADQVDKKRVCIKTSQGDMLVELDHAKGPRAASNFLSLVKAGFYNGTIFHRVIPGFMIQGGDPTGTGMSGPGYQFENDEVTGMPEKEFNMQGQQFRAPYYADGWVAMANAGRDTNGSQFFIMVADYPLSPDYSVFGRIVEGLDVAKKIAALPRNVNDRPNETVTMQSVTVQE